MDELERKWMWETGVKGPLGEDGGQTMCVGRRVAPPS